MGREPRALAFDWRIVPHGLIEEGGRMTRHAVGCALVALAALVGMLFVGAASVLAAGNVAVAVSAGALALDGDEASNEVTIDQAGLASDQLRVTPAPGTTVNSSAGASVFSGVTKGISAALNGGDDVLAINSIGLTGNVAIDGGDTVHFMTSGIDGNVTARMGDGINSFAIDGGGMAGSLAVTGGADFDSVTLTNTGISGAVKLALKDGGSSVVVNNTTGIGKDLRVTGGRDFDSVTLDNGFVSGSVKLALGDGGNAVTLQAMSNVGRDLTVTASGGDDSTTLKESSVVTGNAKISLGDGGNTVVVNTVTIGGDLTIKTGGGDDTITLTGQSVGGATAVDADGGMNSVTM
jgi:hypothetical protein